MHTSAGMRVYRHVCVGGSGVGGIYTISYRAVPQHLHEYKHVCVCTGMHMLWVCVCGGGGVCMDLHIH